MSRLDRSDLDFRLDDLSGAPTRALIARHLAGMHAITPAESVHALGLEKLREPNIRVWSAWSGDELVAIGALKRIDEARGELKSMRVADAWLGKGAGRAVLDHLIEQARAAGLTSLWLETGASADFLPAQRLYETGGFERCGPFEGYGPDPFSVFMTRRI